LFNYNLCLKQHVSPRSMHVVSRLCFYLATLCKARYLLSSGVCPSVTLVDCIHVAEDIVQILVQPGSSITLFLTHNASTQFQGNPFSGAQNTRGEKILLFSTEIVVYLGNGTRYALGWYGTLIGSHRRRIDPCRFRRP